MALPTLTRSWQFQNNIYLPNYGNLTSELKKVMWTFKQTLTTFPTNPWKCVASSNCATCLRYGVDALGDPGPAYDTWGQTFDASKIYGRESDGYSFYQSTTNSKHSWIVLRNTQLDDTYDLCIDMYNNNNNRNDRWDTRIGRMYVCRSYNLTGSGSITARPSPNGGYVEAELRNGNGDNYGAIVPGNQDTQFYNWRLHAQMSTDGLGTRMWLYGDRLLLAFWMFERTLGVDPAIFVNPVTAVVRGKYDYYGDACSYGWLHDNYNHIVDGWGSTYLQCYLTGEALSSSVIGEAWGGYPNEITGNYPMSAIGVACATVGKRGRLGYLADIWWGQNYMDGTMYPSDESRQFCSIGSLVVPWDGTNPLYTS